MDGTVYLIAPTGYQAQLARYKIHSRIILRVTLIYRRYAISNICDCPRAGGNRFLSQRFKFYIIV
jgi:hypothetical protein